ncbi:FUSC family protein [[Clostridium] dakarense]|uniref:FUSC family protein n=1 Tax=Faecalimicrobium dakarense TaxID=1301100 RepID=UPI0004B9A96D|nr:aromatic acid exporter family protein [[Clostridium] dakarense]
MKLEKIGMRTIKSGIAVSCCVMAGKYIVQNPMYSAVACIISMKDTVTGSLNAGFDRIKGTIIGGIIGFLMVLIKPGDPILCGLGVIATIYICNILKLNTAITVANVAFTSIYLGVIDSDPAIYSFHRIVDTSIGVITGVVINYLLARPNYLGNVKNELVKFEKMTLESIKHKIVSKEKLNIAKFEKEAKKLEGIYKKLVDESRYSRDEINTDKVKEAMNMCKEIYSHIHAIELLNKKLYLNNKNYENLKILYNMENIEWDIDEEKSPVFNYHLSEIIEEMKALREINKSN